MSDTLENNDGVTSVAVDKKLVLDIRPKNNLRTEYVFWNQARIEEDKIKM